MVLAWVAEVLPEVGGTGSISVHNLTFLTELYRAENPSKENFLSSLSIAHVLLLSDSNY